MRNDGKGPASRAEARRRRGPAVRVRALPREAATGRAPAHDPLGDPRPVRFREALRDLRCSMEWADRPDLRAIARLLGHAPTDMLARYARRKPRRGAPDGE